MDPNSANQRIKETISNVGVQMKRVSQDYDGIFSSFLSVLIDTLESAPSMQEAAGITLALADEAVETMRVSFVGQPKFDCKVGCSDCCNLFVAVPPGIPELIHAHVLTSFSPQEIADLVARLEVSSTAFASSPTPGLVRSRCPLLSVEGACMVYEVRPISCRSFTSTSRTRCHDMVFGTDVGGRGVDQNPARYRIYENATKALQTIAMSRGLSSEQVGLSQALLELLEPRIYRHFMGG